MISQWNTPIATPVQSSAPEPLSVILQRTNLDVNERIRQVCANIMHTGSARILSDTSAVLEQLPNLLLLLKEASAPSVWITEDSANQLMELFGLRSPRSLSRLLLQGSASFVFPLNSLPASIDWTSSEFSFYKHLSYSQRKHLIDLHAKTLHVDAIDYFFFVLGCLSLIGSSTAASTSGWTSSGSYGSQWYDPVKKGSLYDRLILELVDLVTGKAERGNIPPALLHKAELTIAVIADLMLDLHLFSINNTGVDFAHVFKLVSALIDKLGSAHPATSRAIKLVTDLLDTENLYSSKFMHRVPSSAFREFAAMYRNLCLYWEGHDMNKSAKDQWLKRNALMYQRYPHALILPSIRDFVHEYVSQRDVQKLLTMKDTKNVVEGATELLEIASPRTGMVENFPGVFKEAPVEALWHVCRGLTWINGKVPKELTDASWRMDAMVNAVKAIEGNKNEVYKLFTWDIPADTGNNKFVNDIPTSFRPLFLKDKAEPVAATHKPIQFVAWDQPVCANEIAPVVSWLRKLVMYVSAVDLRRNPSHAAWARSFASVSVLTVLIFLAWVIISIAVCPNMNSGIAIAIMQLAFVIVVGLLVMKWISAQYRV